MTTAAFPWTRDAAWPASSARPLAIPRAVVVGVLIAAITIAAAAVRVPALSTYGFSEDEINKVEAIEEYRHGRFGANAEHPMLMKLAMLASVEAAGAWNRVAPPSRAITRETAVRLPNAIAGAATTLALFGLAHVMFGPSVALMTAVFWAFDVNAIAINRIGKEDTFVLFFFVVAMWCYERGKRNGALDLRRAQRWYTGSGAAFGLMLASKYMPHYLGIYALFNTVTDVNPGRNRPNPLRHFGAMAGAFLAANPAVLQPATWQYWMAYVHGSMLTHHGYPFAGHLYVSDVPVSPLGVPATFYLQLLGTKVPLAVLGAASAGLIELVRRRRERGFTLLRVWLVFFLLPYSLMAAKFLRYALPLYAVADVIAAVGVVAGTAWLLRKGWLARPVRVAVSVAAVVIAVGGSATAAQSAAPFYSLFRNAIGERMETANTFPEETYDYGVREAVAAIASASEPGAVIVSDATGVVARYLEDRGRTDLASRSFSAKGIPYDGRTVWVIVQNEHVTFENADVIAELRRRLSPWHEVYARDVRAVQIFRLTGRTK